jgi:acetyl-CoA carboxylase biotin carboxylase subunit
MSAADVTGAEAIHPGYGFLSENAQFAEIVTKHGLKFIGPSSDIIKKMGDKIQARKIAKENGLPVIEGSEGNINSVEEAKKISAKIGYPVLIKAAGGGGGKGMKVAYKPEELEKLLPLAKLEAKKYFNNDNVYIEKYFINPRHIEVQILSGKNRTVHLNERDCSVQRKHQKLIEETPSPVIDQKIRSDLLEKTVKMVEKIGYEGAGTVEYIYEKGKFYFLEMNTRVQVEHPVTEVSTGIDIIKQQIAIASTGNTDLTQDDVKPRGHAIECRINAEDPSKNFQPSPGIINVCHQPSGFRTRVDGAIFQGCKITPYYDSLICKLICNGRNRTEAIQRMLRALDEFVIEGITTTINLHKKILRHEKFLSSDFDVNWLVKEKFY